MFLDCNVYLFYLLPNCRKVVSNKKLNSLFVFIFKWGAISIALATSCSALFNAFILSYFLAKDRPSLFRSPLLISFIKTLMAVGVAGAFAQLAGFQFCQDPTLDLCLGNSMYFPRGLQSQFWGFFLPSSLFFGALFLIGRWLGIEEWAIIFQRKKLK